MVTLSSSAIRAVDYDPIAGTLDVQFTSSSRWYTHFSVPYAVYRGLITASSAGRYYHDNIKGIY